MLERKLQRYAERYQRDVVIYGDDGLEITRLSASATSASVAAHLADAVDAHDASAISVLDTANDFTATDVEGALAELQSDHEADVQALTDHLADAVDAHDASAISIADAANDFTATDVEGALAELQSDAEAEATTRGAADTNLQSNIDTHLADAVDAHDASAISVLDTGSNFTATDVETALAELADELDTLVVDPEPYWPELSALATKNKHVESIGDGTATSFTITHSLGTYAIRVAVVENSTGDVVLAGFDYSGKDAVIITFAAAPTASQHRVVVVRDAVDARRYQASYSGVSPLSVVHNLGTSDVVPVARSADGYLFVPSFTITSANAISIGQLPDPAGSEWLTVLG